MQQNQGFRKIIQRLVPILGHHGGRTQGIFHPRLLEAGGILFGCQERTGTAFHAVPVLIWNQGHDFCHLQVILDGRGQIGPSDGKLGRQPFDSSPIHHAHGALQFIDGRPGGQAVLDGKR